MAVVNLLSDEIIKQIAESKTGRTYPHEGKAMALEILEWRKRAKEAAAAAKAAIAPVTAGPAGASTPSPVNWPFSGGTP